MRRRPARGTRATTAAATAGLALTIALLPSAAGATPDSPKNPAHDHRSEAITASLAPVHAKAESSPA
ncbi:hypothetical protein [Streptomyces sp. NPDC091217]|uniref:hypothetical protein n=1 Tax=Streptomyces sp. NPDC091217 TaxID=3365975 RepID=UPI003816F4ED